MRGSQVFDSGRADRSNHLAVPREQLPITGVVRRNGRGRRAVAVPKLQAGVKRPRQRCQVKGAANKKRVPVRNPILVVTPTGFEPVLQA